MLDNVFFPPSVQGVPRARRGARARSMISPIGRGGKEASLPRRFSGGQKQRAGACGLGQRVSASLANAAAGRQPVRPGLAEARA
jgi:ABC-type proline/glycine betaine transport system ATPase subunit